MRFANEIEWKLSQKKEYQSQAVPGHGESVSGADERGKLEQKRGMILTCVRTPALLLRFLPLLVL